MIFSYHPQNLSTKKTAPDRRAALFAFHTAFRHPTRPPTATLCKPRRPAARRKGHVAPGIVVGALLSKMLPTARPSGWGAHQDVWLHRITIRWRPSNQPCKIRYPYLDGFFGFGIPIFGLIPTLAV